MTTQYINDVMRIIIFYLSGITASLPYDNIRVINGCPHKILWNDSGLCD